MADSGDAFSARQREASAQQRRQDLEEKRKRLAELRERKVKLRQKATGGDSSEAAAPAPSTSEADSAEPGTAAGATADAAPVTATAPAESRTITQDVEAEVAALIGKRRKPVLSMNPCVASYALVSTSSETYEKSVQTDSGDADHDGELDQPTGAASDNEVEDASGAVSGEEDGAESPPCQREFSTTEIEYIESKPEYVHFLRKSSNMVDRLLSSQPKFDFTVDHFENVSGNADESVEKLHRMVTLNDSRVSKNRCVSSISWSPVESDLLCCSYQPRNLDRMATDREGLCILWSLQLPDRPEKVLRCDAPVTTCTFAQHAPDLIIGGLYSGQIVIWDKRVPGERPVQQSPFSSSGHTFPIFGLSMIGTAHAQHILSLSTDGRYCVWAPEKIAQPIEHVDLYEEQVVGERRIPKDLTTLALAVPAGDTNKFVVGCEDGSLYTAFRHGSKTGVQTLFGSASVSGVTGHHGPITSIHAHPGNQDARVADATLSDLVLSTSVDWTCHVWSHRYPEAGPLLSLDTASQQQPIYGARWSPTNQALFATVNGAGHLSVWDIISEDVERRPVEDVEVCSKALNALEWSCDGRTIAVGDSMGATHVYNVSADLHSPQGQIESSAIARLRNIFGRLDVA